MKRVTRVGGAIVACAALLQACTSSVFSGVRPDSWLVARLSVDLANATYTIEVENTCDRPIEFRDFFVSERTFGEVPLRIAMLTLDEEGHAPVERYTGGDRTGWNPWYSVSEANPVVEMVRIEGKQRLARTFRLQALCADPIYANEREKGHVGSGEDRDTCVQGAMQHYSFRITSFCDGGGFLRVEYPREAFRLSGGGGDRSGVDVPTTLH